MLLLHIVKLRVAKAEYVRIGCYRFGKSCVSFGKFLLAFNIAAVAPGLDAGIAYPFYAAVFADEHRLAAVFLAAGIVAQHMLVKLAVLKRFIAFSEILGFRPVIVNIVNIGLDMEIAARIYAGAGGVGGLRGKINAEYQLVALLFAAVVPGFVERAPADY